MDWIFFSSLFGLAWRLLAGSWKYRYYHRCFISVVSPNTSFSPFFFLLSMIEKWSRQLSIMLGSCSMLTGPVVCHVCMNTDRVLNLSPAVLKYSSSILMACVGRGGSKKQGLSSPVSSWNSLRAYVVYLSLITDMSNFSALVALQKKKLPLWAVTRNGSRMSWDKLWNLKMGDELIFVLVSGATFVLNRRSCILLGLSKNKM